MLINICVILAYIQSAFLVVLSSPEEYMFLWTVTDCMKLLPVNNNGISTQPGFHCLLGQRNSKLFEVTILLHCIVTT